MPLKGRNPLPWLLLSLLLLSSLTGCAASLLRKGGRCYKKGRYEEAVVLYEKARKKGMEMEGDHLYRFAASLLETGRYDTCIKVCRREKKGGGLKWRLLLAEALYRSGRLHSSIEEYEKIVEIAPSDLLARVRLGVILVNSGFLEKGIERLVEATGISPSDPLPYRYLYTLYRDKIKNRRMAYFFLKMMLEKTASRGREVENLREEMRRWEHENPDYPEFYEKRGIIFDAGNLLKAKRWKDAVEKYREFLDMEPENPNALFGLGKSLYHSGKMGEALPLLKKAYESDRGNRAFARLLARLYQGLKRCEEGKERYRGDPVMEGLLSVFCP